MPLDVLMASEFVVTFTVPKLLKQCAAKCEYALALLSGGVGMASTDSCLPIRDG